MPIRAYPVAAPFRRPSLALKCHQSVGSLTSSVAATHNHYQLSSSMLRVNLTFLLLAFHINFARTAVLALSGVQNATLNDSACNTSFGKRSCAAEDVRQLPDHELEHLAAVFRRCVGRCSFGIVLHCRPGGFTWVLSHPVSKQCTCKYLRSLSTVLTMCVGCPITRADATFVAKPFNTLHLAVGGGSPVASATGNWYWVRPAPSRSAHCWAGGAAAPCPA